MSKCITHHLRSGTPARIDSVSIGYASPDEIRRLSVVRVTDASTSDKGVPKTASLSSHLMGSVDRRIACGTCGRGSLECNGHMGHIELPFPCLNPCAVDRVVKVLRCVCFSCCRLLAPVSPAVLAMAPQDRFAHALLPRARKKFCPHCMSPQPRRYVVMRKVTTLQIDVDWKDVVFAKEEDRVASERPFTALDALQILSGIPDADLQAIGFDPRRSHPAWMILSALPVPPPVVRPSISEHIGGRARGLDDLTTSLKLIVKDCARIDKWVAEHPGETIPVEVRGLLQYNVAVYVSNDTRGLKPALQKSGTAKKGVAQRFRGKEGRLRGTLMGGRVDYTARCVITPDPAMDIVDFGIPVEVAMVQSYTEEVTPFNIARLRQAVVHGPSKWPGANAVITPQGLSLDLPSDDPEALRKLAEGLGTGHLVSRHLVDGDWIVANRQPSLHKMSMMGHRVRVFHRGHSARLHNSDTTPYGGDFDGDEMNVHAPQSAMAVAEVAGIMAVPHQIVTPQSSRPIIGLVQDCLVAAMRLSRRGAFLTRAEVSDLVMQMHGDSQGKGSRYSLPPPAIMRPRALWTGKQAFSILLPIRANLCRTVRDGSGLDWMDHREASVLVREGELLAGSLCKATVGVAAGGLIEIIWRDCGPEECHRFMSDATRLLNRWFAGAGFSVGMDDLMPAPEVKARVKRCFEAAEGANQRILAECGGDERRAEKRVRRVANALLDRVGAITMPTADVNALQAMVECRSKGNPWNNAQMRGALCQQHVAGQRVRSDSEARTLPCYARAPSCPSLAERGLVSRAYHEGLRPEDMFVHAMGGREGLVDTAVKTSETGYIQRRLMKFQESLGVQANGLVMDSSSHVMQFAYGGDGMDASRLESVTCDALHMSDTQVDAMLRWGDPEVWKQEAGSLRLARDALRTARQSVFLARDVGSAKDLDGAAAAMRGSARAWAPANPARLLEIVAQKARRERRPRNRCDQRAAVESVDRLVADIERIARGPFAPLGAPLRGCLGQVLAVRSALTTRRMCGDLDLDPDTVREACAAVLDRYERGLADQGEMVGALAAQSIGEPTTQLTLNMFHSAGTSVKNVTMGIPRLREIVDGSRNMKRPCTTVFLREPFCGSKRAATVAANALAYMPLASAVSRFEVVPHTEGEAVEERMDEMFGRFERVTEHPLSRWIMVFELDRAFLDGRGLSPDDVRAVVARFVRSRARVTAHGWVLRVRLALEEEMVSHAPESVRDDVERIVSRSLQGVLLASVALAGVRGIASATPSQVTVPAYDPETGAPATRSEWVLHTEGNALRTILGLPWVDGDRTFCNDPHQTLLVHGIEAAVCVNAEELRAVITQDGTFVNPRHISLTVDTMSQSGFLLAMSRHGISHENAGFLVRSSFETAGDEMFDAAVFAESSTINGGVTESLIVGSTAKIGSAVVDVLAPRDWQTRSARTTPH